MEGKKGSLEDVIKGADVFIGVSVADSLKKDWVKKMSQKAIIFALANPNPEISPVDAAEGGAFIYASGRSDFSNQINNSLVFPGIFKGIIRHNLEEITEDMKLLAAEAISNSLTKKATTEYIIPDSLDRDVTLRIMQELGKAKI